VIAESHPLVKSLLDVYNSQSPSEVIKRLQIFLKTGQKGKDFLQITLDEGKSFHCYYGCGAKPSAKSPGPFMSFLAVAVHMLDHHR
jgi:hypothetical protein